MPRGFFNIAETFVTVMAVSYVDGQMESMEVLTVKDPSALLSGDTVKVFFLSETTYIPIRTEISSISE